MTVSAFDVSQSLPSNVHLSLPLSKSGDAHSLCMGPEEHLLKVVSLSWPKMFILRTSGPMKRMTFGSMKRLSFWGPLAPWKEWLLDPWKDFHFEDLWLHEKAQKGRNQQNVLWHLNDREGVNNACAQPSPFLSFSSFSLMFVHLYITAFIWAQDLCIHSLFSFVQREFVCPSAYLHNSRCYFPDSAVV